MRQLRILRRACVGMILVAVFVTPLKGQEARATEDVRRLLQQHVESLNHEIWRFLARHLRPPKPVE